MKKSAGERNIIILAILIVLAVAISGYLMNSSLTQIVNSIHDEASTDYHLIVIKDISLDLLEIENSIQLYTLTKNRTHLENYKIVSNRLKERLTLLANLTHENDEMVLLNDTINNLVEEKLEIWDEIRRINIAKNNEQHQFDELYLMLEKKEVDTIQVEVKVEPPKKKGIFRKIFGKKDSATIRIDTNYVERAVENEEIKEEIEALETDLKKQEQRKNRRELRLIEQNIQVTGKLNHLIAEIEEAERDSLIEKNNEADRLATIIYNRLSAFSVAAVILLFIVLYLFVRYLQKSRKVRKALIEAKQGAEKLAKAKEIFMANVSHEMRTPVNAIYGLAEQLLQKPSNENLKEKHEILLKSSKHLKEVVNDTLDFSKLEANKIKIQSIDFSPENVIREMLSILKPEAQAKHIDLNYKCENSLPMALQGDPFRLKQILLNTIGNAIKFTEEGSVTLIAESKRRAENSLHLNFVVNDTGIGISEENLELIFEDFVQIETDYTRKFGGTGLGLSIVKKLIELQGGSISIKSEVNSGTSISFYIPYSLGSPENIEKPVVENIVLPAKVKDLKIMVVDDDEYNRYVLKIIFDKWGLANYREAANGNEAVRLAKETDFDLIFMDLRMPELNGIEATKLIKEEKPYISVVAFTTLNNSSEMKMCQNAGMMHFLSKPFTETELLNTIVTVLNIEEKDEPKTSEFNLNELKRLANNDRAFVKEMILIFMRSTASGIENMKQALELENWQGIADAAHKMSSPCKHINANHLYHKLKLLEEYTRNEEHLPQVPGLVLSVENDVKTINASLSVLIDTDTFDS